ncbi:MAG: glycosyltransferase [Bernardetiaceae bacterium]|nr:glycosyltransferase [Bernardetiaceae bacterium]
MLTFKFLNQQNYILSTTYPKITVVTPSYNQGVFIEQTIRSVLSQNYPNLEYIIIDGGSNDASVDIITKYAQALTYWESKPDRGQSHAINKGFQRATGDIITWLNSDDTFTENALHKVAQYFTQNPEIALLHGKTIIWGKGMEERIDGASPKDLEARALGSLPFPQPSSFFKRRMFEEFGALSEDLHYGMDYDFFVQILLNYPALRVDDVFSRYLYHEASKSVTQHARFAKDYAFVFSKILRATLPESQPLISQMKSLGLYVEGKEAFALSRQIDISVLERAFCHNLYSQLRFYYSIPDSKAVYHILKFLKKNYLNFYKDYSELASVYWRSRMLPDACIRLLRGFKN